MIILRILAILTYCIPRRGDSFKEILLLQKDIKMISKHIKDKLQQYTNSPYSRNKQVNSNSASVTRWQNKSRILC